MVLASLVFCVILATVVWLNYWNKSLPGIVGTFVTGAGFLFFTLTFLIFQGAIPVFLLLIVAATAARRIKLSPRWFAAWCGGVVLATFGTMMVFYIPIYHEHQRLLAKYPVVNLAPRLSYETALASSNRGNLVTVKQSGFINASPSGPADPEALNDLETKIEMSKYYGRGRYRDRALRAMSQIHLSFVEDFVDQPGFGFSRIPTMTVLREHHLAVPEIVPIPQPSTPRSLPVLSPGETPNDDFAQADRSSRPGTATTLEGTIPLPEFNALQVANFASADMYGLVIEKRQVRGFLSHAFRKAPDELNLPEEEIRWKLAQLQLVSLLRHQPSAAYISENLPAMDELQAAPTRPLDEFEAQAIARIRNGEEVVVETNRNDKRMVGSIRAAKHCMECHQVARGDLLGAFTYRFYRDPLLPEPVRQDPGKRVTLQSPPRRAAG